MFHFTPLLGAHSPSGASQSLLEFEGGIRILTDVGWDGAFDVGQLKELERLTPTLSLVLLTHATTQHLGAFAHACKHFPLFRQIPIYATTPVISLGQTLLNDMYASTPAAAGIVPSDSLGEAAYIATPGEDKPRILFQAPTPDEVRSYFGLVNDLKYSQPHQPLPSPFSPPLNGLSITAYSAGHTPGGTIWHIQHGMESVVYASDWNLTRENILSGAAWLLRTGSAEVIEQLKKPTALVCSSKGAERIPLSLQKRDEQLLDMLRHGIERGGTVLVPSDSSARVLEIAYMLDKACASEPADSGLRKAKIFLAGRSMGAAIRYAKSMLEWMNESVVREFENRDLQKENKGQTVDKSPFDFRFVRVVERKKKLEKILSQTGPRIILASDDTLSWGFSREVLEAIAGDNASSVVLTDEYALRGVDGDGNNSLGKTLWTWYQERQDGVALEKGTSGQQFEQAFTDNRDLTLHESVMQPLEGTELTIYQNYLATQRQLQNTMQSSGATGLEATADVVDDASSDASSSTDESDEQGKALNFSSVLNQANKAKGTGAKEALGINALLREPGFYDWDVRGKKGREGMFPFPQKRRRIDDYGEMIRPEDYLRAEERDEMDGQDMRNGEHNDHSQSQGQKRKWDDSVAANGALKGSQQVLKKRKVDKPAPADKGHASDSGYASGDPHASSDESESEDEYNPEDSGPALPSKLLWRHKTIKANLRIGYVDFAGIHDQRSLTMLVPLINPRKLVLTGGTRSETTWLANECAKKMNLQLPDVEGNDAADILLPENGEVVVASMDTHAWTVTLSRALTKRLHWQNVRGLGIVTLTGRLEHAKMPEEPVQAEPEGKKSGKKLLKQTESMDLTMEDAPGADIAPAVDISDAAAPSTVPVSATTSMTTTTHNLPPVLDVVPTNLAAATRTFARPLHVGDLRLADLRKLLGASGHRAEFRGEGTLVVDGIVAVRKAAGGRIEVEGSETFGARTAIPGQKGSFWEVRRRIYEGLAVIAGG